MPSFSKIVYQDHDRPIWVTDANGVTVTNSFDLAGRLASRKYPDGGVEKFGYSASGLVAYTNQIGKVTRFTYHAPGWKTFEPNANSELLQFQYDQAGTEILRYAYNAGNRLTNMPSKQFFAKLSTR